MKYAGFFKRLLCMMLVLAMLSGNFVPGLALGADATKVDSTGIKFTRVDNDYTVFGRVSPEQKAILVKSLKAAGHVTAMTGDGVNDILALKEADCAVSVAAGSDAAKNVSHLVLLDNNFNSMPKVVHEGRRVINNVQNSASLFFMKTLFTMLMGIITLCLPYMATYPFLPSQMIILEARFECCC